jgi:hypothetical protein
MAKPVNQQPVLSPSPCSNPKQLCHHAQAWNPSPIPPYTQFTASTQTESEKMRAAREEKEKKKKKKKRKQN